MNALGWLCVAVLNFLCLASLSLPPPLHALSGGKNEPKKVEGVQGHLSCSVFFLAEMEFVMLREQRLPGRPRAGVCSLLWPVPADPVPLVLQPRGAKDVLPRAGGGGMERGETQRCYYCFQLVAVNEIPEAPKCFVIPQQLESGDRAYGFRRPGLTSLT